MTSNRLTRVLEALQRWRVMVAVLLHVVILLSVIALFFIPMHHSLDIMLPTGSASQRALGFLREIDFSAKLLISLRPTDPQAEARDIFADADKMAESLVSPLITNVVGVLDQQELMQELGVVLQHAPELLNSNDLEQIQEALTPENVNRKLRAKYRQLLRPEGTFLSSMVRSDPLDIRMMLIERVRRLAGSFGYRMEIVDNHIVSPDGRHVLLVAETSVPFTDAGRSQELVSFVQDRIDALPAGVTADIISGHTHTLSNEAVIKRDIRVTVSVAAVAFFLVFLLCFRDLRALLVFALPFAVLPSAVVLTSLLLGTLSPMMLGLGAVIAGIAVDYGIHVFVAMRRSKSLPAAIGAVVRPVSLGAATTGAVFFAFFFSKMPGYHQLACFSLFSVLLAVGTALFILPLFLKTREAGKRVPGKPTTLMPPRRALLVYGLFAGLLLASLPLLRRASFDPDVAALDGTAQEILEREAAFERTWGSGNEGRTIVAVRASNLDEALEANDHLYDALTRVLPAEKIASFSQVWKSPVARRANRDRWNLFWSSNRIDSTRQVIAEQGANYGFSASAFDPFFASLVAETSTVTNSHNNLLFNQLRSRFVFNTDSETRVLTYLPDTPETLACLRALEPELPGLIVVSRGAMSQMLAQDYTGEFSRIAMFAVALVLLVAFGMLRNATTVVLALLPALTGTIGVVAFATLLGVSLNVMNLVSGIIVIGLCIDYGVFYVHAINHESDIGTRGAITLSAATTVIGAAALLFANHPALFSVGITLVGGILVGYATAMLLVPACCTLVRRDAK